MHATESQARALVFITSLQPTEGKPSLWPQRCQQRAVEAPQKTLRSSIEVLGNNLFVMFQDSDK